LHEKLTMKIADHIVSAVPVHDGSMIYKAGRRGGGYVAIQLFPFQLSVHQYQFFGQQVSSLVEAFEEHNAAVPRILNHGLTQTGSLPFVEMEWIESHIADEFHKTEPALSIEEISRIAEQIASVLTYCQKLKLLHGHINKGSIIWHPWRKRYILSGFRFGIKEKSDPLEKENFISSYRKEHKKDIHDFGKVLLQLIRGTISSEKAKAVPGWLVSFIEKCITDDKESFQYAGEAYDYVLQYYKPPLQKDWYRSKPQQPFPAPPETPLIKKTSLANLKIFTRSKMFKKSLQGMHFVLDRQIIIGLIIAALLAGFSIYAQRRSKEVERNFDEVAANTGNIRMPDNSRVAREDTLLNAAPVVQPKKETVITYSLKQPVNTKSIDTSSDSYKVRSKAYLYNQPDERTRRTAFIVHWNNAVLHPLKEEKDFIYIVFTNDEGQTSKGWLRKKDLIKL
jgi:eukaryotic-like serine/threonine-protein kinase